MTPKDAALLASLTGFTPSPWRIRVNVLNDQDICDVSICGDIFVLADLDGPQYAHQQPNAALIAAAPDLHRIATEQAAEIARLQGERGELAACLFQAIDMLDDRAIYDTGENFNNPRFNAALAAKP